MVIPLLELGWKNRITPRFGLNSCITPMQFIRVSQIVLHYVPKDANSQLTLQADPDIILIMLRGVPDTVWG